MSSDRQVRSGRNSLGRRRRRERPGMDIDGNLHVLAKPIEDVHQPVDGEAFKLHLPDAREIRRAIFPLAPAPYGW